MKTCINCGAQIEERNHFCPHCGTKCDNTPEEKKPVEKPTFVLKEKPHEKTEDPQESQYPMKWHNFQMVIMILGGILAIANGLNQLTGNGYLGQGVTADQVYSRFPVLKSCDIFYGIILIALGVFELIVRSRLNKFQTNGPGSLKTLYILSIIGSLIYLGWASSATGISMFTYSNMGSLGSSVLFLIINSIYYSKRSSLFVN